jgi:hypothetical protein
MVIPHTSGIPEILFKKNPSRLLGYPKTMSFRDLQGILKCEKYFITIFELIGQFYCLTLTSLVEEIHPSLRQAFERFQSFLILQI